MPRPLAHPEMEPLVWAVDEWHAPTTSYRANAIGLLLGRPSSSSTDIKWLLEASKRVVAVAESWLDGVRPARLYCYEFDPAGFEPVHETAGYYTKRRLVMPAAVRVL